MTEIKTYFGLPADAWIAIGTIFLSFATTALTVVTIFLVCYTKRLFFIAKGQWRSFEKVERKAFESRQKELRAYLHIKEIIKVGNREPNPSEVRRGIRYRVIVKNYGKTPAHDIQFDMRSTGVVQERGTPFERGIRITTVREPGMTLGPDGEMEFMVNLPAAVYEKPEMDGLIEGSRVIYIRGTIIYFEELLLQDRDTEFRYIHEYEISGSGGSRGATFTERIYMDTDGNRAT